MYVCVCVCMYVCIYVCVCICVYVLVLNDKATWIFQELCIKGQVFHVGGNIGNGQELTEDDWSNLDSCPPYEKSKTLAEKAAWEYVQSLTGMCCMS